MPKLKSKYKQLSRWFLLVVMIVVGTEAAISKVDKQVDITKERLYTMEGMPSMEESIVQWQTYFLHQNKETVDVVLLGDSSCLMGLDPAHIEEKTNLKVRGLGTVASFYTEGHALLLQNWIEQNGPPRLVVYHTTAIYGPWGYKQKDIDRIGLVRKFKQFMKIPHGGAAWYLPSYHLRFWFRRELAKTVISAKTANILLTTKRGPYPSDEEMKITLQKTKGRLYEPERWDWQGEEGAYYRKNKIPMALFPETYPGLQKIIALAQQHAFGILIMMNPFPEITDMEINHKAFAEFMAKYKKGIGDSKQVMYYSMQPRFFPDELCGTICHLTPQGSIKNSEDLSTYLLNYFRQDD